MNNFAELIGRTVLKVVGDSMGITFLTDKGTYRYEPEGDCCSQSWFEHVTGAGFLRGQKVLAAREVPLGEIAHDRSEYDCLQSYEFQLDTPAGTFTLEMRNNSNGYYGGYLRGGESERNTTELASKDLEDF